MDDTPFPVCITFDIDAEAGVLARDPANADRPVALSAGRYGPRAALPHILDLLDRHAVPATFFVPGWTADHHTDAVAECARRGHEVAHHGYHHIRPDRLESAEAEREELERGSAALESATGERPVGYRAPNWELSPNTLALIAELGFAYSSNMMDADGPYRHLDQPSLAELPVSWTLDDWPHFGERPEAPPARVGEIWRAEFDAQRGREGAAFMLAMHPQIIGRPARLAMLDRFIEHIKSGGAIEFVRCRELAERVPAAPD